MMQTSKNTNFGSWYILTVKFNLHRTRSQPWKSVKARVSTLAAPARPICNRKRWRRNGSHRHDGSAADDSSWSSPSDRCNLSSCFQHFCSWTSVNSKCLSWHNIFKKSVTQWLSLKGFDSTRNGNTGKCNCRDVKQKKCDSLIDGEI